MKGRQRSFYVFGGLTFFGSVVFMLCVFCHLGYAGEKEIVSYVVEFLDESDRNRRIFSRQEGGGVEGSSVSVAFPERIAGADGWFWEATMESPQTFLLYGFGTQKFDITYKKTDQPSRKDEPERDVISGWFQTAWLADCAITGQDPDIEKIPDLTVKNRSENNSRIKSLLSIIQDDTWHYFYMIGKDYFPETLIVGQDPRFRYSAVREKEVRMENHVYNIVKVGVCRISPPDGGTGSEDMGGGSGGSNWYEGASLDAQIGNHVYRFTCVDEDYSVNGDHRKAALFLCDSVIRSDIDRKADTFVTFSFGENNNYKDSDVRKWLLQNGNKTGYELLTVPVGTDTAYTGGTKAGTFEQLSERGLKSYDIGFQLTEDNIFCLSLEEALKYRKFLWKFGESSDNNPKGQLSPYSAGYYLRTPFYKEENGGFCYSEDVYVVDLVNGNIHTAKTGSETYGLRPAFVLPQE